MTKPRPQQQHPTTPMPDRVTPTHDDDATIPGPTPPPQQPSPGRNRRQGDQPAPGSDPAHEIPH
jgi:hypothetical protein